MTGTQLISTARPEQGTRAGSVHDLVWRLRAAADDPDRPGRALAIARQLDADTARAALIVAIVSERWTDEDRAAMARPEPEPDPGPDYDRIRRQNETLRAEFTNRQRQTHNDQETS